jgi:selenocysteine-specific elongation factor
MPTLVIGTAGHIDHGKTTLLRALTGIDADRLPEEQRRGMTIDVGYAHLDLDDGSSIDFVDVPGHDGLVGNMLVGAGEIDAAMLVVAADDGPRAQTLEHLELVDALEIHDGVAVITKADLVSAERVDAVRREVAALLARTTFGTPRVISVSATSGAGLGELRAELLRLRDRMRGTIAAGAGARLAIDRVFSVRGRGAVVTGTLRGGLSNGDTVTIEPGGRAARIREIQVHGRRVERSDGGRTALNLAGLEAADLHRGDVVLRAGGDAVAVTDRPLVALREPVSWIDGRRAWAPPSPGDVVRLHSGTAAVEARVTRRSLPIHGDDTFRVLRLASPLALAPGDRFALRAPAPVGTVAAGQVLDVSSPRGPARRRATGARLRALLAADDPAAYEAARLELHGYLPGARPRLAADVRAALEAAAITAARDHAGANPASAGLQLAALRRSVAAAARREVALGAGEADGVADAVIDELVARERLARSGDRVRDAEATAGAPDQLSAAMDRLEAALAVPAPPSLAEAARAAACPPEGIAELARSGRIVRLEPDLAWASREFQRLAAVALSHARREPLTPATLRDSSGTSRRYVLAILEDLDRRGILARTPAGHVPGPRAPAP